MLSKNKIKYIHSLELKKHSKEEATFIAEGNKLVGELLQAFPCQLLLATREWFQSASPFQAQETIEVTKEELSKASLQKAPQDVLAVFEQPKYSFSVETLQDNLCLALDDVQDPGNLGTIIRIADWFGIKNVFCSTGTVDVYNPKTVQATMGAIARVKLHYTDLRELMRKANALNVPIFGTFLDGDNMYSQELANHGIIVMGNEGNGISPNISNYINRRLFIPNYPVGSVSSESLNVAVATAVICAEFRRRG